MIQKNIRGFSLLELIVVVALVGIISAIGTPQFIKWKKDREVRVAAEKVAQVISGVNAQTKRGAYSLVKVLISPSGNSNALEITGEGMSKLNLTTFVRQSIYPKCESKTMDGFLEAKKLFDYKLDNISMNISVGVICFSENEKYYQKSSQFLNDPNYQIKLDNSEKLTSNYVIVCSYQDTKSTDICDTANLKKPAYLISWSRFGNVMRFRWSGSEWTR